MIVDPAVKAKFVEGLNDENSDANAELFNDNEDWQRVVYEECITKEEREILAVNGLTIRDICKGSYRPLVTAWVENLMHNVNARIGAKLFNVK